MVDVVHRRRVAAVAIALSISGVPGASMVQETGPAHRDAPNLAVGSVRDASTDAPVAFAAVTLSPLRNGRTLGVVRRLITDGAGTFVVQGLPPGLYAVRAEAAGYLESAFGRTAHSPPQAVLEFTRPGARERISVYLQRSAAISGTVLDQAGEPITQAAVRLIRLDDLAKRVTVIAGTQTDDLGRYRIGGLEPGVYIVAAMFTSIIASGDAPQDTRAAGPAVPPARRTGSPAALTPDGAPFTAYLRGSGGVGIVGYTTTFSPQASDMFEAEPITLRPGDERVGVSIVCSWTELTNVQGQLTGMPTEVSGADVYLLPPDPYGGASSGLTMPAAKTKADGSGAFAFTQVPRGRYWLVAAHSGGRFSAIDDAMAWAQAPVVVPAGSEAVTIAMQRGVRLTGRIEVEPSSDAETPPPDVRRLTIHLVPVDAPSFADVARSRVQEDGAFVLPERPPGRYVLSIEGTDGLQAWRVAGVTMRGADVSIRSFELRGDAVDEVTIRLTRRRTQLEGHLAVADGRPAANMIALIVPSDVRRWLDDGMPRSSGAVVRLSQLGTLPAMDLTAGEYRLLLLPSRLAELSRERVLASAQSGFRISLAAGQSLSLTARLHVVER